MKGQGKIKYWFTKNGVHVPVYEKYTTRKGVEPENPKAKFKKKETKSKFDTVHEKGLAHLVAKGNTIVASDVTRVADVNHSTDNNLVTALVKSKSGKYTIRQANFATVDNEYKQRMNFNIWRQLRGQGEDMARLEYEDYLKELRGRLKRS